MKSKMRGLQIYTRNINQNIYWQLFLYFNILITTINYNILIINYIIKV
jgi:hypothetical protein